MDVYDIVILENCDDDLELQKITSQYIIKMFENVDERQNSNSNSNYGFL